MAGSLPLNEPVFVSGQLATGVQLLKEARRSGAPVHANGDTAVYKIPGLWTWTLNPYGTLERQPCQVYTLPYEGRLFRLRTRTGREIRVTADHPFLVNARGQISWKLAKDLKIGDYLVTPRSLTQAEDCLELMTHQQTMEQLARRYQVVWHEELLELVRRLRDPQDRHNVGAVELNKLRIACQLSKRQLAKAIGLPRQG
jgi:hypothetical protein